MTRRLLPFPALLLTGGCAGLQSVLDPAGEQAGGLFSLLMLTLLICGPIYLLVLGFLGWSIARAPNRLSDGDGPMVEPEDRGLGRGLVIWAGVIVAGVTVLAVGSFVADRGLAAARARDAVEVRVTGHQWWWRIQYRDPATRGWIETANELHLPAGRTARIALGTADVIHSFWIPNVAGKLDMIPGRRNTIDLTPRRTGWFRGQCAEFCGAQHAHMAFDVKVDTPAQFAAWLAGQARAASAPAQADAVLARGMQVVTGGACAMCHVVRGTPAVGRAGPDLTHVGARRSIAAGTLATSRGAMQGWVAQPQAVKPGTTMPPVALSPADADAVSRYLMSLK